MFHRVFDFTGSSIVDVVQGSTQSFAAWKSSAQDGAMVEYQ